MKYILMVGFSGILDTGWVGDWKMMRDKLIDGKELSAGLELNQLKRLNMLVVNIMIIQKYSKEKAAEYYFKNKEAIKKKIKESIQKLVTRRKRQD